MQKPHAAAGEKALLDDRGYTGALIRGQNPALLFEKGVRERVVDSYYWKEQCFGLNAATLCDRAVDLRFIGGTYGLVGKPTPFLCLAFKLLQLVPGKDVILEYLNFGAEEEGEGEEKGEEGEMGGGDNAMPKTSTFKYLRALAAFYIRLAWEPVEIFQTLEPLLTDLRKLKRRTREGFALTYMDQFIDDLLTKDRVCATALWKLPKREYLEDMELLEPRVSPLAEEVEMLDAEEEEDVEVVGERRGRDDGSEGSRGRSRSYRSGSESERDGRDAGRWRSRSYGSGSESERDRGNGRRWRSRSPRSPRRSRSRSRRRSRSRS